MSTAQDLQHLPFSSLNISNHNNHNSNNTRPATVSQPLFNLPPSRFLWQKMFFSNNNNSNSNNNNSNNNSSTTNGPESLPCQWLPSDEGGFGSKSPLSLNHIKQNSFDSGIHTSDSEYSVRV
jgi:hypothetical protein